MAEDTRRKVVKVVVLGDIGRSPRMQYHSLSLANSGLNVNIISYVDSQPIPEILEHKNIVITRLQHFTIDKCPQLLKYVLKTIWQTVSLFLTLLVTGNCDFLLCQNPPAIPTLPVCRFYCLISRSKFVIDWHNYAYTIMGLGLSPKHPLVRFAKLIEKYFGQSSDDNLCVTYAMKNDLIQTWNIKASVLYDRPPKIFKPLNVQEKHDWFLKLSQTYPDFGYFGKDKLNLQTGDVHRESTAFTHHIFRGPVEMRPDRPGLLFSSTSWTQDEDFSILFNALIEYETAYNSTMSLPKLICVITGKGPMKDRFTELISQLKYVKVVTPWLEAEDYPKMVGSADLGVCLHTSSSGLDLPMKVVDMFGAGLPVCAYDFQCLDELVKHGQNGYVFKDHEELAEQIIKWFTGFPRNIAQTELQYTMKEELKAFQEVRWEDNWDLRVKKIFQL